MPHLNELADKFGDRGLSIVAVTSEGAKPTEKWIEETGAEFPYAYDKGGSFKREMGVSGIPNAVLIDSSGRVVWQGNPYSLTDEIVEGHLDGTLETPVWEWPATLKPVKNALIKHKFKKALDACEKLDSQESADIGEAITKMIEGRIAGLKEIEESGDFLTAQEISVTLVKQFAGLPAADEANAVAKAISSNPDAKKVIKGQKAVRKLRDAEVKRRKDGAGVLKKLTKLSDRYSGTAAGREADDAIAKLEARMEKMR